MFAMLTPDRRPLQAETQPKHPWTNGQVERINRTINKKRHGRALPYEAHDQLHTHLADFVNAYSFARRLKTLKGLCKAWTKEPDRVNFDPLQHMPELNI